MKTQTLIIAALLIGGGFYLYSQHQKAQASAPSLEARATAALTNESNPFKLDALANECDRVGTPELAQYAMALRQKAAAIRALQGTSHTAAFHPAAQIAQMGSGAPASSATLSLAQAVMGSSSIHAPKYARPAPVDPNLLLQGL